MISEPEVIHALPVPRGGRAPASQNVQCCSLERGIAVVQGHLGSATGHASSSGSGALLLPPGPPKV